jgi:hypothetical protein
MGQNGEIVKDLSSKTYTVGSSWSPQGKLVKGQNLSSTLQDAGTSCFGEAKSYYLQSWHFIQSNVVCNSPDNNSVLVFLRVVKTSKELTVMEITAIVQTGFEKPNYYCILKCNGAQQ